jgi:hypothetical protein
MPLINPLYYEQNMLRDAATVTESMVNIPSTDPRNDEGKHKGRKVFVDKTSFTQKF